MYNYIEEKPYVFTDIGQRALLSVRDKADSTIAASGAVTGGILMSAAGSGDSFKMMACVDRLVELGELIEITIPSDVAWQNRVFVAGKRVRV